jgi:hypothetical protein
MILVARPEERFSRVSLGYHYEICGIRLESEIPLSSLRRRGAPATGAADPVKLRIAAAAPIPEPSEWIVTRTYQDVAIPYLSVARLEDGYLVRVHDQVDFHIDDAGSEIVCSAAEGVPALTIEQLLLDQILPQVLHLLGRPPLHASAVALGPGSVVAFLGRSGMGKSTLAASFVAEPGAEASLVSDDCLALSLTPRGVEVRPSYPAARLRPDAAGALFHERGLALASPRADKLRVDLEPPGGDLLLERVYVLEAGDAAPTITRLSRRDGIAALAGHLHRLDPGDRRRLAGELARLEAIVNRVAVARLVYRRSFEDLPAVRAAIRADIRPAAA